MTRTVSHNVQLVKQVAMLSGASSPKFEKGGHRFIVEFPLFGGVQSALIETKDGSGLHLVDALVLLPTVMPSCTEEVDPLYRSALSFVKAYHKVPLTQSKRIKFLNGLRDSSWKFPPFSRLKVPDPKNWSPLTFMTGELTATTASERNREAWACFQNWKQWDRDNLSAAQRYKRIHGGPPETLDLRLFKKKVEARNLSLCHTFSSADLLNPRALAEKLRAHSDPVSAFLWSQFSVGAQAGLTDPAATKAQEQSILISELNAVLKIDSIYTSERFAGVDLSNGTKRTAKTRGPGEKCFKLNRILLEAAYRQELRPTTTWLLRQQTVV